MTTKQLIDKLNLEGKLEYTKPSEIGLNVSYTITQQQNLWVIQSRCGRNSFFNRTWACNSDELRNYIKNNRNEISNGLKVK